MYKRIYTANDEMQECQQCDHYGDDFACEDSCGAAHGWWGYCRTELEEEENVYG